MTLEAGTKLGRYEIRSKIGEGGMGEVYLALDTKLDRKVALKILPKELASNQDRMRRFTQEAKAAAALNHPNIAHIYEIGEHGGTNFIAMEYVDGYTLRQLIHERHTDLAKLLRWLQHVAEGLAKAHAAGIVHRDLKPDNIMVTRDEYVKIVDFGLAKLVEPQRTFELGETGSSEVATAVMPQQSIPGLVMGTLGYMSPEQATGRVKEIDHRSDIFSFGCILFEAATGQKAFAGKDVLDSLHKIVHAPTPQLKDFNANTPDELQRILRRCLAKEPDRRYQSIRDVAIELEELQQELKKLEYSVQPALSVTSGGSPRIGVASTERPATGATPTETARSTSSAEYLGNEIKRHKRGVLMLTAFVVVAVVAFGLYKFIGGYRARPPLSLQVAKLTPITTNGKATRAAISPDGKYVAYAMDEDGKQSLWLRQVATGSSGLIVPAAEVLYQELKFSRDGNFLYYVVRDRNNMMLTDLYQTPLFGHNPRKLIERIVAITFSPDAKRLAFIRSTGPAQTRLIVANADGTNEQIVATHNYPNAFTGRLAWSPDGKVIACTAGKAGQSPYETLVAVSVDGAAEKPITAQPYNTISSIEWLADGRGVIISSLGREPGPNSQLWQLSYPGGEERKITNDLSDYRGVSLTSDSSGLITLQENRSLSLWIAPPGGTGHATQITARTGKTDGMLGVAWTPDGRIVYYSTASGSSDLWIMNSDGSNQRQLTMNGGSNVTPTVSPDGRYVVFGSNRAGARAIWRMNLDGSSPKQLADDGSNPQCSPDGKWVVYHAATNPQTLWKVPIEGGTPVQLSKELHASLYAVASPDGKLIAYFYGTQPQTKISIMPFEGGPPIKSFDVPPISLSPGLRWTPDGRALTYVKGDNVWSQPIDGGTPKQLTDLKGEQIYTFDWSRDGRLLVSRGVTNRDVVLISNLR